MAPVGATDRKGIVVIIGLLSIVGIIVWYVGRAWYASRHDTPVGTDEAAATGVDMTELKFLTPKELLARLGREEKLLLIDIRPKESYAAEHIVDAISVPAPTLNAFAPGNGQTVIIISGPEIANETLKSIHLLFTDRSYQFAFLQGTVTDWRFAGGTTISSGDPESPLDYSKIIFIENDQVLALAATLVSPLYLDVRENELYTAGHLPGAINIPLHELERRRADIPRQKSIFVYGNNEFESYQAGVRLFDIGFFGVRVIRGGFDAWKEKSLPIETAPAPATTTKP